MKIGTIALLRKALIWKPLALVLIFWVCERAGFAQFDYQLSQYMHMPMLNNPGAAGLGEKMHIMGATRQQWSGLEGAPQTMVFGAEYGTSLFGIPSGIGLVVVKDKAALFSSKQFALTYSYHHKLTVGYLGVGLQVGFVNQVFDGTKVSIPAEGDYHTPGANDPAIPTTEVTGTAFDFGIGVQYRSDLWGAGMGLMHLGEPKIDMGQSSETYLPRTVFLTGYYNLQMNNPFFVLKPSVLIKSDFGVIQTDLNVGIEYKKKIYGGVGYRLEDAMILQVGTNIMSGLRVTYSYDLTTSEMRNTKSSGSHEISLGYRFDPNFGKREKQYKSIRIL